MSGIERIPDRYLPDGVSGSAFDPDVLRLSAQAHNHVMRADQFTVKPWVILYLLDVWEAACDAATATWTPNEAAGRLLDVLRAEALSGKPDVRAEKP